MSKKQLVVRGWWLMVGVFLLSTINYQLSTPVYAAFKEVGWGARASGMGGAYVAVSDDCDAIFWNPAGLAQLKSQEAAILYHKPYLGLEGVDFSYSMMAGALPLGNKKVLGFGYAQFDGSGLYSERSILISAGGEVFDGFLLGVNLKQLSHQFHPDERTIGLQDTVFLSGGEDASAFTVDFGALVKLNRRWKAGLGILNLIPADVGLYFEDKVPMHGRLGISYYKRPFMGFDRFTASGQLDLRLQEWGESSDKMNAALGAEGYLSERTALRAGFNLREINAGIGFITKSAGGGMRIDYSFRWPLELGGTTGSHLVQIQFRFAAKKTKKAEVKEAVKEETIQNKDESKPAPSITPPKKKPAVRKTEKKSIPEKRLLIEDVN